MDEVRAIPPAENEASPRAEVRQGPVRLLGGVGPPPEASTPLLNAMGGADGVRRLVSAFYARLRPDAVVGALFAEADAESERKQALFLVEWLGGPKDYSREFGSPRLRGRHERFPITRTAMEHWVALFEATLAETGVSPEARSTVMAKIRPLAAHMVNRAS